jgi:putative hydrolase of the HAD superfamily
VKNRLLAFDLDDTLYPEKEYVMSGFKAVSHLLERDFGIREIFPGLVKTFNNGERKYVFNVTFDRLGIEYDEKLIRIMVDCYRGHDPNIKPFNDVVPILHFMKERHTLVMVTDGYHEVQKKKVKTLEIGHFFDKIVFTDEYGGEYWKPSLKVFQMVMDDFSARGNECTYVGDNINKDFFAPNKLGWLTILIEREEGLYSDIVKNDDFSPKIRISSLFELNEVLNDEDRNSAI